MRVNPWHSYFNVYSKYKIPSHAKTEIFLLSFPKNTFWLSTLRLCKNFACGWNQIFFWCSQQLLCKFSYEKIKVDYYEFFGRYQATLFGAKSKMKTSQNAHNSPLLFFCMKLWTYLTRLGKEKKIFVHRQFQKINLKISGKIKFQ